MKLHEYPHVNRELKDSSLRLMENNMNTEWITDRLPTADDTQNNCVWLTDEYGDVVMRHYVWVEMGTPWQPIPKPAPYVEPKR
jgi:hypothetical protein